MPTRAELPITPLLPEITGTLARATRLVLEAPPGAGKTTQVPLALLDAAWLAGRVLMLEPRRLAARAAAATIARTLGEPLGARVGYRIRGEAKVSSATRIEIVTEAILTRMLQDDPALDGVGAVLFDEFHERNLHADLGLAFALDVQANLRPELRLVLMSATLDGERLARFLDAPRLACAGRGFPVTIEHFASRPGEDWIGHARRAVAAALERSGGDVLVFLPGKREIEQLSRALAGVEAELLPLHGELDVEAQQRALAPDAALARRVLLATNVAESSVTLPGVTAVVDLGLAREPRYDPASGLSRLETVAITRASAEQRAGRAGRVAPGLCLRLWPESRRLDATIRPELTHVELMPLALELAAWGEAELRWLDPPPAGPLAEARERLVALGAIDAAGRVLGHGRALLELGTHPRLGHAVLAAPPARRRLACELAALLETRDPLRGEARRDDDLGSRLEALWRWRRERRAPPGADAGTLARIAELADDLARRARVARDPERPERDAIGALLALAYPDRIARQDPSNPTRYTLANGRGARLGEASRLLGARWLVAAELRFEARDSLLRLGAPLDEAELREADPDRFTRVIELAFNDDTLALEANEIERYGAITLSRRRVPVPAEAPRAALLIDAVRRLGLGALGFGAAARQWRARVECLRHWLPNAGLPDVSDAGLLATLERWLGPSLERVTRLAELDAGTLADALARLLGPGERQLLDAHAPVALTVPSGRRLPLTYQPGQPPVLEVKLQEMFGAADTPKVARGRVPVTLHLLSPAQRPIQVTQDLAGFWQRTYPELRRALQGRYPRHPWPEDPWRAPATHRAKPRG